MEFNNWLTEYTGWQIVGMLALVSLFLFVVIETVWILFKYIRNYKD